MKEVTLNIPDNKFEFFMTLIQQLGIQVNKEKSIDFNISESRKTLVRERIRRTMEGPKHLLDWNKVHTTFTLS